MRNCYLSGPLISFEQNLREHVRVEHNDESRLQIVSHGFATVLRDSCDSYKRFVLCYGWNSVEAPAKVGDLVH